MCQGVLWVFFRILRCFRWFLEGKFRGFPGGFQGFLKVFQGCFRECFRDCFSGVAEVLQIMSQGCYSCVQYMTSVLQLHKWLTCLTRVLQRCYSGATYVLHDCHIAF